MQLFGDKIKNFNKAPERLQKTDLTSVKQDFLHEKTQKKKAMIEVIQIIRNKQCQEEKKLKGIELVNLQLKEETDKLLAGMVPKQAKTAETMKISQTIQKEIVQLESDGRELAECKVQLQNEMEEEKELHGEIEMVIAQMKRSIADVRKERERISQQAS